MAGFDPFSAITGGISSIISSAMQNAQAQKQQNQAQSFDLQQAQWQTMANQQQAIETQQFDAQQQQQAEAFNASEAQKTRDQQVALADQSQMWTQQNMASAEEYNTWQAQVQRDYETQMSNTAYQRSRADMVKAGLNPMLMAGMGGASTPAVASPSINAPSGPMGSAAQASAGAVGGPSASPAVGARGRTFSPVGYQSAVSTALEAGKVPSQMDVMDANATQMRASAGASNSAAALADSNKANTDVLRGKLEEEAKTAHKQGEVDREKLDREKEYLQAHPEMVRAGYMGRDLESGAPKTIPGALYRGGQMAPSIFDHLRQFFGVGTQPTGPNNAFTASQSANSYGQSGNQGYQ